MFSSNFSPSKAILRLAEHLYKVIYTICLLITISLVLLVTAQVILRYVFSTVPVWIGELSVYMIIWVVMLLVGPLIFRDEHLQVEFVFRKLPRVFQFYIRLAQLFLIALLGGILIYYGYDYATTAGFNRVSVTLGVDMFWIFIIIPISGIFMTFFSLAKIIQIVNNPDQVEEDYSRRFQGIEDEVES